MKIIDKAVSNTIYLFISQIFLAVSGFLFWVIAGKLLKPQEYGIASTTINFISFVVGLITLGLPSAILKLVPEYLVKKDAEKIKKIVSTATFIVLLLNMSLAMIIILNRERFSVILKIPVSALYASIIAISFFSLTNVFSSLIFSLRRLKQYLISDTLFSLSKLIFSVTLMLLGFGFYGPIVGFSVATVVWFLTKFTGKYLALGKKYIEKGELLKYAIPGLTSSFLIILVANSQYITLSVMKTASLTGLFGVAMVISNTIGIIPGTLYSSIFPLISGLSAKKNSSEKQKRLIYFVLRYTLLFTIPMIFIYSLFSRYFILLFSSSEYLSASVLLPILSTASLIFGLSNIFSGTIYALKKPNLYKNILLLTSGLFLIVTPLFTYLWADMGISVGYLSVVSFYFVISLVYLEKQIPIKFPSGDLVKLLFVSAIAFLPLYIFKSFVPNLFFGGALIFCCGTLYLFILLMLRFYSEDDIRVLKEISEKIKILKKPISIIIKIMKTRLNE